MKKKITSILAIISIFALIFSLAACGKKVDDPTSTSTSAAETNAQTTNEDTTAELPSEDVSEDISETAGETDTTANDTDDTTASGDKTTSANANKAPETFDEIAAYYNAAANKVKKENPKYTMVLTNIIGDITSSNGLINSVIPKVVPMFSTEPETFTQDTVKDTGIPVYGQNYGGKVQASSLSKATCSDKGSYYEIRMDFKEEKLSSLPTKASVPNTRHGQAFNVLVKEIVDDQVSSFSWIVKLSTFAPTYKDSYVVAHIEKSTGRMLYTELKCTNNSSVEAKIGFTTIDAQVYFGNNQKFTYKY